MKETSNCKEYNFKIQLIKTSFYNRSIIKDAYLQDIRKVNDEINALLSSGDYSTVEELDKQYKQECSNLEHKISVQIQNECEQYWLNALL